MSRLERAFLETVSRESLFPRGTGVCAAVSGGADSVAMMHLLARLGPGKGWKVRVLHVNHGLREEADADELFVAEQAAQLELPFFSITPGAGDSGSLESRWSSLRQTIYEAQKEPVAVAHTADDRAETILLRLFEGAGLRGLGGMDYRGVGPVRRPMLDMGREDVRNWLGRKQIPWREDRSNMDRAISRNRLRLDVMPALKQSFPEAVGGICRSGSLLSLWRDLQDGLGGVFEKDSMSLADFRELPDAMASLALWQMAGKPRKGFDELMKVVGMLKRTGTGSHLLPGGKRLLCDGETVRVTERSSGRY